MKKLLELKGVKKISRNQQKEIKGGDFIGGDIEVLDGTICQSDGSCCVDRNTLGLSCNLNIPGALCNASLVNLPCIIFTPR